MAFDYADKIRNLLDAAEATERTAEREIDPERADGYRKSAAHHREMAERLMIKYRIAEEEALAVDADVSAPITRDIVLTRNINSPLSYWYVRVFSTIAAHTGVRFHSSWVRQDDGTYVRTATVVGYEGDVRYTEFLWTAAYMMFSTRVDPVWDDTLPETENVYRLRNAGIERRKIADRAWGNGTDPAARSKVQRIYTRECARRGEEPLASGLSHNTDVYRQAYALSFSDTLARRLQNARDAADSVAGAITLHGRSDRVEEAFYARFPSYRPSTEPTGPAEPCQACAKAKSGHCRKHPKWSAADERRWVRDHESPSARAGHVSGRNAADGVVIERGHAKTNRLDASGREITG
jgi:hypothetical protein